MSQINSDNGLAFRFARQLRDAGFRDWLARRGYVSGMTIAVVGENVVVDQEVLRRSGECVVQEVPGSEFGWRLLPE